MQVMVQQHLLKRAAEQHHRAEAVRSHTHMLGTEQVLHSTDAQLSASCSDYHKRSSSSQTQSVAPVTWMTSDPWFAYTAVTIAVGVLAFK